MLPSCRFQIRFNVPNYAANIQSPEYLGGKMDKTHEIVNLKFTKKTTWLALQSAKRLDDQSILHTMCSGYHIQEISRRNI
jgi:hypothetical protein